MKLLLLLTFSLLTFISFSQTKKTNNELKVFCRSSEFKVLYQQIKDSGLVMPYFSSFDNELKETNLANDYFIVDAAMHQDSDGTEHTFSINNNYVVISYTGYDPPRHGILIYNRLSKKMKTYNRYEYNGHLGINTITITCNEQTFNKKTGSAGRIIKEGTMNLETGKIIWTKRTIDN